MTELEAADIGHYNLNKNMIQTNKRHAEKEVKQMENWAKDEFKIHWEKTQGEIVKTVNELVEK